MPVTDEQLDKFLGGVATLPKETPPSPFFWQPSIEARDKLNPNAWTSGRIEAVRKSLNGSMGINDLIPPTEAEQQGRLQGWWREEGQFIPRHVLDQLGIVGGEKVPTLKESIELENKQQLTAVKDFLQIEPLDGKDPLAAQIIMPEVADPKDLPIKPVEPKMAERIKATSIEDLKIIRDTVAGNLLEFDEKLFKAVDDEIKIKETIPQVMEILAEKPLTILLGTDFFNKIGFNLPEFTSRKGFSPTEALLGLPKGSESIWIRAVARVREQVVAQDPTLLAQIGAGAGGAAADLIKFVALPDPSKLKAFASLSPAVKAAIGVGTKAGLVTLLQAPEPEETIEERVSAVAISTGVGALTGAIIGKIIDVVKNIPLNKQVAEIVKRNPALKGKEKELAQFFKDLKAGRIIEARPTRPIPVARRIVPKGFRLGMAEIEKPAKIVGKAAEKVTKAKAKEALAIEAAKKVLALKIQPSKAVVPVKILTKKEALSLQESNLITGEGDKIRIVADPEVARALQTKENEIAKLKTRREELKAQKEFAVAKAKAEGASAKEIAVAKEIARKEKLLAEQITKDEEAFAKFKETAGVKLEQTIEGSKIKIAKIRAAKEFKDSLRNDAVSMIVAIPKELRAGFINRANKVTTLKGLQKITDEIELGIDKFERAIETRGLAQDIKKLEKDNRLGQVRLGKVPSPQRERLIETIDSIDLVKMSEGKREDLLSLQKYTQKLSSQLAGVIEALDDDVEAALLLPNQRVNQLLRLSQKPIDEVDIDDIKLVRQSIASAIHEAKLKSKLLTKEGLRPVDGAIKTITTQEIAPTKRAIKQKGKPVTAEKGVIQKTLEFGKKIGVLDDAHLDTLVELSTGPNKAVTKQIFDTDLHRGQRELADNLVEWLDSSSERFEKIGFETLRQIDEEVTVILGGKEVKLTINHLIKLELHSRSPDNLKAILKTKGWAIGAIKVDYPEGIDRLSELNEALKIVRESPIFKGIADWTGELNPARAEVINEATKLLKGHEIARDATYTSRPRDLPKRVEGGKADISVPPEQQGQYLPRTGGAQRIRLDKWSDDFLNGLESDAMLGGMAIPLRNARIIISNPVFQDAMREAGREIELQNMITILRRLQGVSTSRSTLEVFGGKIQRRFVASALGWRVSTIGTQAMSYPAAFGGELIPFKYQRPLTLTGKDTISRIEEDSSIMKLRWKGRRIGVEVGTSASFEAFDVLVFGKAQKLSNKALRGLVFGDKQAIGNIYKHGVIKEIQSESRNGKNIDPLEWEGEIVADLPELTDPDSKAFRYAAARRLEYVVRRSQPMFDMLDRSVSLSNPDVTERALFIFRTALEAQENRLIRATDIYTKSPKKLTDKRKLLGVVSAVTVAAFSVAVWKRGFKWAVRTGEEKILEQFGVFKFDDRLARQNMAEDVVKDTAKNIIRLTKVGKFAVDIGERIAESVSGDGYNWNRNSFDVPILDVLQSGVDASVAISRAIVDAGLLDEFVEEITTKADQEFNKKLEERILSDVEKAIKSTFEFGVRISGKPFLAPVQEFLSPLTRDSKVKIIREVTFGDVEDPRKFANRVFTLFEKHKELNSKAKTKRLTSKEEETLATLDRFTNRANDLAKIVKQIESPELRSLQFKLFETNISIIEDRLETLQGEHND